MISNRNKRKFTKLNLLVSLFLIFFLISLFNFDSVKAQNNDISLTVHSKFDLLEFANSVGTKPSNDSISLALPSDNWNVTSIELNFTDVKQEREINVVEHNATDFETLRAAVPALGVQIDISEPTTIFGVYIFGAVTSDVAADSIDVQINGYDSGEDEPDDTIYGSTSLNISRTLGWHLQTFDEGIPLSPGDYYLVINGIGFPDFSKLNLYWFFNDENPQFPNLYVASYYWGFFGGWTWRSATQNKPFLYKIIQRVNRTYVPENINMTAEIRGSSYPIINGTELGTGCLKVRALNFSPKEENLAISIKNNESIKLFYNLSYKIGFKKEFSSPGSASIKESSTVNWTIIPEISRVSQNYSVKFKYSSNWHSLNVLRDEQNITAQVFIDPINKYIHILNNTIVNSAAWSITAKSQNIAFPLEVPITEYGPNEILYFYINPPISLGNYSILLIDTKRTIVENYSVEKNEANSSRIEFTHTLPSKPDEGTYKAYIFWNNATYAGVTTQTFSIVMPFVLDPILVVFIAAIIIVAGITCFASYKAIKRSKRTQKTRKKTW